jgi:hypothetical protein
LHDPPFMAQPKRLPGIFYNELAAHFVTSVTLDRVKAFDLNDFGPFVVRELIAIAMREYPLSGSTEYSMEEICVAIQMDGWWRTR